VPAVGRRDGADRPHANAAAIAAGTP